jgi:hypothetical protein
MPNPLESTVPLPRLTTQESRHRLARKIFHDQRGELRRAYQEGLEDQLGALGLMLNAVVRWNTCYTDAALNQFRATGQQPASEDAARLSPLVDAHVNMLGPVRLHSAARHRAPPAPGSGCARRQRLTPLPGSSPSGEEITIMIKDSRGTCRDNEARDRGRSLP